ncbi:MAG: endonuclease domain-containing protein [Actinomycetota bacterium]
MSEDRFHFVDVATNLETGVITGTYAAGGRTFQETWTVGEGAQLDHPAIEAAIRWLFLLGGVSAYKTSALPVLDTGSLALTDDEAHFLREFYVHGLGEFAHRNGLDLRGLQIVGPRISERLAVQSPELPNGPLIPFGGGIDSIVTVEAVKQSGIRGRLFICSRPGDLFAAIESPAACSGLEIIRATRQIDPLLYRSTELGFLNGHVPITGVLSALAVVAALAHGHDAVLMSNEHSASDPNLVDDVGMEINHQWSKSEDFEEAFAQILGQTLQGGPRFSSFLRTRSELWVGREFSKATTYHSSFRSCNKAFRQDPEGRLLEWCGVCDKCCFIDLVLAPYLSREELSTIFHGREPLEQVSLLPTFETLIGRSAWAKPFECVGDPLECRAAASLAALREDRSENAVLASLVGEDPLSAAECAALLEPLPRRSRD